MKTEEHNLVKSACNGHHPAMEELFMQNKEKIYHLAFRYAGNQPDAEDLMQEIFAHAFIALAKKKYKPHADADFSTWLYRVGINYAISFLRKNKKFHQDRRDISDDYNPLETTHSPDPGPEHSAVMTDMHHKVNACLAALSPKQRMIFVLRHYEGLQMNEIAQHMNCSTGSIKKQLFRATASVRETLAGENV